MRPPTTLRHLIRSRAPEYRTYVAIAKKCGLHKSILSCLISGRRSVEQGSLDGSLSYAERLSRALGIPESELLKASQVSVQERERGGRP